MTQGEFIVHCLGLVLVLCLFLMKARSFLCVMSREPPVPVIPPEALELKVWPEYFHFIWDGSKTFEIRKNDRDFLPGQVYYLRKWIPPIEAVYPFDNVRSQKTIPGHYEGSWMKVRITYVATPSSLGPLGGVTDGFCVWGFKVLEKYDAKLNLHLNDRGLII